MNIHRVFHWGKDRVNCFSAGAQYYSRTFHCLGLLAVMSAMLGGCASGGGTTKQSTPVRTPTAKSLPVEDPVLAKNRALATHVISMGPPTTISFVNGRLVNDDWDAAASEDRHLDRLKALLDEGTDPNALHISAFQPKWGWDRKSEGATSSLAVAGSQGKLVEPTEGGQSLLDFCRKYNLTRAAALLEAHGAK